MLRKRITLIWVQGNPVEQRRSWNFQRTQQSLQAPGGVWGSYWENKRFSKEKTLKHTKENSVDKGEKSEEKDKNSRSQIPKR